VAFNWCSMPVMSGQERMKFEYISTKRDKSVNGSKCVGGSKMVRKGKRSNG